MESGVGNGNLWYHEYHMLSKETTGALFVVYDSSRHGVITNIIQVT